MRNQTDRELITILNWTSNVCRQRRDDHPDYQKVLAHLEEADRLFKGIVDAPRTIPAAEPATIIRIRKI